MLAVFKPANQGIKCWLSVILTSKIEMLHLVTYCDINGKGKVCEKTLKLSHLVKGFVRGLSAN